MSSWQDTIGIIAGLALIPMMLSYVFKENIVYEIAERTFLALEITYSLSAGYILLSNYFNDIMRAGPSQYIFLIWLPIGAMILFQVVRGSKSFYYSRLPMALFTGVTVGLLFRGIIYTGILQSVVGAIKPIDPYNILYLTTFIFGIVYFMYAFRYRGVFKAANNIGLVVIMLYMGQLFGTTALKRVSALSDALQWILTSLKTIGIPLP